MGQPSARLPLITAARRAALLLLAFLLFGGSAAAASLSVLTQNMNRFFDDVDDGNREKILSPGRFRQRVETAAVKFGETYGLPHIIALQEVENANVLQKIAAAIERRYGVGYRSLLIPGNDPSGINLAYLLRTEVRLARVEQLFADDSLGANGRALFSRPPLYLEACLRQRCLTLVNLHLRSMRGIGDRGDGARVRHKRRAQAEAVARFGNRLQHSSPGLALLILGDFNALTPGDGHVDIAGILRGNPDNRNSRLHGRDLVEPDLVDLSLRIPAELRYSYVFRRQNQQLDYMLVNRDFAAAVEYIGFGSIDRAFSDHAGLLARFDW